MNFYSDEILVEPILNYGVATKNIDLVAGPPSIPQDVLTAVKDAPLTKFGETIDENPKSYSAQILKFEWLTINARGRLVLTNFALPWIAIVAKNISIENAPNLSEKAIIMRASDADLARYLNGPDRAPYPTRARDGGYDTGEAGNSGAEGVWGGDGYTAHTPKIYVFFENIDVATQDPPAGGVHIRFEVDGPKGGDGGNGGNGQDGGVGGRGTPSSCDQVTFPINTCTSCKSGPGDGGRGGDGGIGGRGGAAAPGGNAADVWFIGPQTSLGKTGYFGVSQAGGKPGRPGVGGGPGNPGSGGGGGYQCKCCPNGGGSHGPGVGPNPPTRGLGPVSNVRGVDGDIFRIVRDNSDLWP